MARASIRDVAQAARVSVGTVSNVLNQPDRVAPATRQRVLAAIDRLCFVRNESARQLRAGQSRTIAFVVLDAGNPFFTDVARGVEDAAAAAGSSVILGNSDDDPAKEDRYLDLLEEQRVQGVLITPVDDANPRLARLRQRGIPVVLVDRNGRDRDCCSVAVDDVQGGRLAAAHLLDAGHRRLAFVGGPHAVAQVADRLAGVRAALAEAGGDPADLVVVEVPALNVEGGRRGAEQLLALAAGPRPTGLVCANDLLALGALQAFTARGVRVPEDIALVGYDDIEFAAAAAVPLSSVRQPRRLLGRTAAELLLEEAAAQGGDGGAAEHAHRQVTFQPELVVRSSSRPAAATGAASDAATAG